MHVTGIGWIGILTEDFVSTVRFFSDTLGLSLAYRDETKELAHFRFRSGQLLEVYGPSNRGRKEKYQWFHGPALGFEVDDVQLAFQEMTTRGARFITELEAWENDMWAMFLAPEDNLFEILRPTRSSVDDFQSVLGICCARILVQNFAGAIEFFSQVMEMFPVKQDNEREGAHFSLSTGHRFEVLGLNAKQPDQMPPITIGFEVDDMVQARQELEARGLQFEGPSEFTGDGTTRSQFRAPDGFIYELVCAPKQP